MSVEDKRNGVRGKNTAVVILSPKPSRPRLLSKAEFKTVKH